MDKEDWLYLISVALTACGCGWWLHPGAGLICAGVGVAFPFVLKMWVGSVSKKG